MAEGSADAGGGADGADEEAVFSLFLMVEFQKFLTSLSVRPGRQAAI